MSWWNTSNFTDLASKALKNAQKKIDSALDIKDDAGPATDTGSTEEKKSKEKSDLWGAWSGLTSGESGSSSWSFPWGAGAEGQREEQTTESLVKVKSAEEIKSEVLKVAKERTKAKAKLFPKSTKTETESYSSGSISTDKITEELVINTDTEKPPDTGQAYPKSKQDKELNENDIRNSGLLRVVDDTDSEKTVESEMLTEEKEIATLELSASEKEQSFPVSFTIEEKDVASSGFQTVNELDVNPSNPQGHEIPAEIPPAVEGQQENALQKNLEVLNKTGDTLVQAQDVCEDFEACKKEHPENESGTCTLKDGFTPELSLSIEDELNVTNMKGLTPNMSGGDISSSMEIVNDNDFTTQSKTSEPLDSYDQSGSDPEFINDQASSDPELIECDTQIEESNEGEEKEIPVHIVSTTQKVFITKTNTETDSEPNSVNSQSKKGDSSRVESTDDSHLQQFQDSGQESEDLLTVNTSETNPESVQVERFTIPNEESMLIIRPEVLCQESDKAFKSSDSESSMNKLDSSMETCTSEDTVIEHTNNSETGEERLCHQGEGTEDEVVSEDTNTVCDENMVSERSNDPCDAASVIELVDSGKDLQTISPAHSFVKCMVEDTVEDGKQADDNSDSHSSIEKSEGSRSVYSNHESGDEIDTTTSSDIEIISYPTSNGESRQISPLDPVPLRMALQKTTNWRGSPTHRRTDSSDSSNASGGNYELSPGRDCSDYAEYHRSHSEHSEGHSHAPELPALSEEDDNPYHPQRLLKKLAEMSEVLQAREDKLLQLSKENCDLMETNSILSNQLKQSEEAREAEMTDVNELTAEFTSRLTEAEKRVSNAIKEKEVIKMQLQDAQAELTKRAGDVNLKTILAEKEEQISGLLQEGEKLSKSQLQSNTVIKKLRQKEKDNESTITTQKKKIETQTAELEHLRQVLDSKEDLEKKQTEAIAQLTSAVKKQEQEMVKLKSEHEDAVEKARGLQVALDNSYKEMAELHRNNAAQDSKAQEAALSAEMQVREELKMALEKQQQQHKWTLETLNMQIEDHRLSMARMEKEQSRREDLFKQEIADLQKQLQEDEARNQELTQGVSLATRPLLRQIENLQSTFNAQSATWEKVERNLSERLNETQNQLAVAMEKERTANEQLMELGSKVAALETQNSRLRQERSQLSAQLEVLKMKIEVSEDAKQSEAAQLELMKQQMAQEMQDLKKDKVLLETQLEVEKSRVEQEKKKIVMLQDQIRDLELELSRSRSRGTPVRATPSPVSVSRQDSMISSYHEHSFSAITQDELDRSFVMSTPNGNKQSLYEALRQSGAANLLENLQSQLKLREGEIAHLQSEIRSLEHTRESMARELVDLSNKNDSLEEKLANLPLLEAQYKDLDQRYNALLQMYGEKTEEAEELKLDLQDVKDMYKAQINHLLSQTSSS